MHLCIVVMNEFLQDQFHFIRLVARLLLMLISHAVGVQVAWHDDVPQRAEVVVTFREAPRSSPQGPQIVVPLGVVPPDLGCAGDKHGVGLGAPLDGPQVMISLL